MAANIHDTSLRSVCQLLHGCSCLLCSSLQQFGAHGIVSAIRGGCNVYDESATHGPVREDAVLVA